MVKLLRADPGLGELVGQISPMIVPFDILSEIDGWTVDLEGSEAASIWDDPATSSLDRAMRGLLIGCDYAVRRGAADASSVRTILARESPVAFQNVESLDRPVRDLIASLDVVGVDCRSRRVRRFGHQLTMNVRSDPALSFEERQEDFVWGENVLSSLLVDTGNTVDGVTVRGIPSDGWGIAVRLPESVPFDMLPDIEREIGEMPSFLGGISSSFNGTAIVVAGGASCAPDPVSIGNAIYAWTRAFFDLEKVQVAIAFVTEPGSTSELAEMHSRAKAFRLYRDAVNAGHPDPAMVVTNFQDQTRENE